MELDSLEVKISAEAQSAEKALDSLISKLQSFSKALGGINTTSISRNLENLAKVGGLKTVTKEVEDLGKTVDNVGKKKTKTEVKVDVKQGLEAIKELQSKFSNIGKGTQFNGNLSSLEKEYDKLSAKLDKLAEREQKALAIGTASTNDKAFQSLQYDIANTINKLAELETKIQSVKNQNTSQTDNIPIFRWDNQNTGSTQNITENIEKSLKSIPETAKYSVEQAQKSLNEAISKVQNAQTNVEDFSQRISQARANLKNVEVSGKGMGTDEWDRAYIALQKVVSEAKQYKATLNERATGINTDISETDSLDTKVNKLREDLKQLKADGFGFGDTAFDKTYQQLNEAEKELAEYKARLTESETSTRSFGNTLKSAATGFSSFISKMKNAGAATLNFAKNVRNMKSPLTIAFGQISKLGSGVAKLYFKYAMLSRVAGALGKVLGVSSDYIEEYNYFQKAIDKIAQENKGNYKKYGYDDAKSYADSFQDRLTTLTGKMTGYKPDKGGNLIDTGAASLGLDITQVTNFEAQVAQMTNSVGMMGEASVATSKAMTMLAGDMSSLTNMPLDTVMKNFSSGLSGAAMAVKKYGMDISVAALQETALGLGVKKNVSDMTQAEKEYLRVITMLQQSKVAWGDLADTINQPANQFRMLKSNIKQCGLMLSRLFMPAIEKILPWLNAMTMAVKDLMKHIGDLFGLKFESLGNSSSDTSDTYDDVSDSADSAADSINDAADAQKKFNKQLQGFDKLNNMTTSDTTSSSSNSDSSSSDTSGVLSDALINAVEDYEKRWNKAFKSMTNRADELKEKIETLFKNAWDTGDGTEIGEALATTLNKGIDYVNEHQSEWSSGLNKITSIMGTTLNGFVKKFGWEGLGQAIGGSIKTALEAETNFFETVNWVNLGKGLSRTLNSAIETGVLQSYFKSMASKLRAAIETAFGAITTFKFDKLGEALGQGINDFFATMNKKNKQTGLNGWQELGKSISDGIKGIATSITTALDTVHWEEVGQAIADFIGAIDWGGVVWSLGKMAKALIKAIGETITSQTKEDPVSGVITIGILSFAFKKGWKKLLTAALASKIGKSVVISISRGVAVIKAWAVSKASKGAKALISKIKSGIGKVAVTFKNVYAAIKEWKVTGGSLKDLIAGIKAALGLGKAIAIDLGETAIKIAMKMPTFAFPDPATDDLVRQIDEWLNKVLAENIPGYDAESGFGIFQLPKNLLVDIPIEIGNFVLSGGLVDAADKAITSLQGVFNKLMGNDASKKPTVETNVDYKANEKSVKEVKNKIPKDKTVTATFDAKVAKQKKQEWIDIYKKFNSTNSKTVIATFKTDTKNWEKDYKKYKNLASKSVNWNIKTVYENEATKAFMKSPLANQKTLMKKTLQLDIQVLKNSKNAADRVTGDALEKIFGSKKKAKGGVFSGGSWHNITKYATGGTPNMGQLFYAREAGPELVGTLKGRGTAVMNNDQIVASVSQGVSDAVYNVMTPVLTSLVSSINRMNSSGTPLYVEGVSEGDIVKITQNANADYKKRYGRPLFT